MGKSQPGSGSVFAFIWKGSGAGRSQGEWHEVDNRRRISDLPKNQHRNILTLEANLNLKGRASKKSRRMVGHFVNPFVNIFANKSLSTSGYGRKGQII